MRHETERQHEVAMKRLTPICIFLVEDNPDDVEIVRRALSESSVAHHFHVVSDGQEALDLLFDAGDYADQPAPKPDVMLLDLNLPKVNGFEVLTEVRASTRFAAMPIVIMTSSVSEDEVLRGYQLGANTYIQKRANLRHAIEVLGEYWSTFATLPPAA
jgi:CheY-like chemotaxis protein